MASDMEKPPQKKRKEDIDPIFLEFRKNEDLMTKLKDAYSVINKGYSRMNVSVHQLRESNARSCESFSSAICDTEQYQENGRVVAYTIGSIFSDGMAALNNYLKDVKPEIPFNNTARTAMKKLLNFISSSLSTLALPRSDMDDCVWAVQLAQHLLSELAVGSRYTLESHYSKSNLPKLIDEDIYLCPCGRKDKLTGNFGDTSFGCLDAWHGSVDILMEDLPFTIAADNVDGISASNTKERLPSDSSDNGDESSVEVKTSDDFSSKYLEQTLAQCIVFSFLLKNQDDKLENYLIPSVGISKSKVIAHFYDCDNDILLASFPLNLFVGTDILNVNVIVFLWLMLNYRCFCSGITDDMKRYPAKFHERVGDFIEKYLHEVKRPACKPQNTSTAQVVYWADESGRTSQNPIKLDFMKFEC